MHKIYSTMKHLRKKISEQFGEEDPTVHFTVDSLGRLRILTKIKKQAISVSVSEANMKSYSTMVLLNRILIQLEEELIVGDYEAPEQIM